MALEDISTAINEGIITIDQQNLRDLSEITNIVLYGGDGNENDTNKSIGKRIINEVSSKQNKAEAKDESN